MFFTKNDTKILKGIAILMLFLHHLFAFPERYNTDILVFKFINGESLTYYLANFSNLCVAIFIFISGFGLYRSYEKFSYIFKRLLKTYSFYVFVFIIVIVLSLYLGPKYDLSFDTFILNLLGVRITYVNEWWFFTIYILYVIIFPLYKFFIDKSKNIVITLSFIYLFGALIYRFGAFLAGNYNGQINIIDMFTVLNYLSFLTCFLIGIWASKYNVLDYIKEKSDKKYLFLSIFVIILIIILRNICNYFDSVYVLVYVLAILNIIFSLNNKYVNLFLRKVGEAQYPMWLIHPLICYVWLNDFIYSFKITIVIYVILLIISYICSVIIMYFYNNIIIFLKNWRYNL